MKKRLPLIMLAGILFWGCEEKEISIPKLSVGQHHVLVEELTGVRCPNCPDGSTRLADLQQTYGKENLIVVSIHQAPDFSVPYTGANANKYDFRTAKGKELSDFIGVFEGAPSAAIDRYLTPNGTSLFVVPDSEWPGIVATEFGKDYNLGLFLITNYDTASRKLDIQVNMAPEKTLDGELRLTVVLTQDSIQDVQNVHNVINPNYYHRHVLRDVITQPVGNILDEPFTAGAVITRKFSTTLNADWNAKHCAVVAYVHHGGDPDKEVLQAEEKHIVE